MDVLEISKLKWIRKTILIHMTIISSTVGKNPLEKVE